MLIKETPANFFTQDGKTANGCFSIDEKNKATICIESEDAGLIYNLGLSKVLNCVANIRNFFFSELLFVQSSSCVNGRGMKAYRLIVEAHLIGVGINVFDLNELNIVQVDTSFSCFEKWYKGNNPFVISQEAHIKALETTQCGAKHFSRCKINDDLEILITACGTKLANFQEVLRVIFKSKTKKYSEYYQIVGLFAEFLSLCFNNKIVIRDGLRCVTEETAFTLYYYLPDEKSRMDSYMLNYPIIKKDFWKMIINLYNIKGLHPVLDTMQSSFSIPSFMSGGVVEKFLFLTKIIDGMFLTKEIYDFSEAEDAYKKELKEYLNRIKEKDVKDFFSKKIPNAYRATFRMKLIQFFSGINEIFEKYKVDSIWGWKDEQIDEFTRILRETRNYYTHLTKKDKAIIAETKLPMVNELLRYLISCYLIYFYNGKEIFQESFGKCFEGLEQVLVWFKRVVKDDMLSLCKK